MIHFIRFAYILLASLIAFAAAPVMAVINTEGLLEAQIQCSANRKLRSHNPEQIGLEVGQIYEVLAVNKNPATHVLIAISNGAGGSNGERAEQRWVSVGCGELIFDNETITLAKVETPEKLVKSKQSNRGTESRIENLMAASWLPTFCLSNAGSRAKECQRLTEHHVYANQFSIHGLWPNDLDDPDLYPCYCHLEKPLTCNERQPAFSSIDISGDLRAELETKMPGIQSGFLHRHEWTKHGTCYEKYNKGEGAGSDAQEYYRDTIHILDQLNSSDVGTLFEMNIGKQITDKAIYAAFDRAFGEGASDRIFINCKRYGSTTYISELFIGLGDEITLNSDLSELIHSSPTRFEYSNKTSCKRGVVTQVR